MEELDINYYLLHISILFHRNPFYYISWNNVPKYNIGNFQHYLQLDITVWLSTEQWSTRMKNNSGKELFSRPFNKMEGMFAFQSFHSFCMDYKSYTQSYSRHGFILDNERRKPRIMRQNNNGFCFPDDFLKLLLTVVDCRFSAPFIETVNSQFV